MADSADDDLQPPATAEELESAATSGVTVAELRVKRLYGAMCPQISKYIMHKLLNTDSISNKIKKTKF